MLCVRTNGHSFICAYTNSTIQTSSGSPVFHTTIVVPSCCYNLGYHVTGKSVNVMELNNCLRNVGE